MDTIKYDRQQLIKIVKEVIDCEGTEEEIDDKIQWLKHSIIDPKIIDYIFWDGEGLTAEQIVDKALSYKPIIL